MRVGQLGQTSSLLAAYTYPICHMGTYTDCTFFRSYDNSERIRGQLQKLLVFMGHEVLIRFQKVEDAMFSMKGVGNGERRMSFTFFSL